MVENCLKLEITIARKCCLKGTDWKLAFGGSVGQIEKLLACVQPSYTRNTYNVLIYYVSNPGFTQARKFFPPAYLCRSMLYLATPQVLDSFVTRVQSHILLHFRLTK